MGLKKWAISILVVLVILSLITPCVAWSGSKRLVTLGDIVFGGEFVKWKTTANLFHSQNMAATDTEALAIAFPSQDQGMSVAPAIAQTSANTATTSETGFFDASWCFTSLEDPGGYTLTPDVSTWHPMKSASMVGSGIYWPYMTDAAETGGSTMKFQPAINTSPDTSNANMPTSMGSPGNIALTGTNLTAGQMASGGNTPWFSESQKPNRDYKNMTKGDIGNMTGLEKMYRNANRKNTIPQTYKGTVDRPTTIVALEKPMDLLKPADKNKVLKDSLNMTNQGKQLRTMFWDL